MRPSFHPGDDPYLYVQQLAAWQGDVCSCCVSVNPEDDLIKVLSGDTKGRTQSLLASLRAMGHGRFCSCLRCQPSQLDVT